MSERIKKTDQEWRAILTPEQYRVCRQGGTEPPFSGDPFQAAGNGGYECACCGHPLFSSGDKYDSGSGWPSFSDVRTVESVIEREDRGLGMTRTEVRCARCDAHLGHVFPDGPEPTGLRYCINSVCLRFVKEK